MTDDVLAGPSVQRCGDVVILTFGADPAQEVGGIAAQLEGHTERLGRAHLLLDFRRVDRISCEELGALIGLQKETNAAGGRLTLFNLRPSVREVFAVSKLDSLLGICRDDPPGPVAFANAPLPPSESP
jgi:anti-anti-sigma factor